MDIKDYLPKKIRDKVVKIDVDLNFDYIKNRSVQHYFVMLEDGISFGSTTIQELIEVAKRIESKSK